jgi:iron complex outermembrane receptor protein
MISISDMRMVALRAGVAAIALVVAGAARADPAAPVSAETPSADTAAAADDIVVTGIRASLDASAKLKRYSPTISETVSAEDIGKLPDVSIAD